MINLRKMFGMTNTDTSIEGETVKSTSEKTKPKKLSIEQQIYNDVYSAESLLLEQAKQILNSPSEFSEEKKKRIYELKELGFSNFDECKKLEKEYRDYNHSQAIKKQIDYCKQTYPLHRFISLESVRVIKEKYDLILGHVIDYIADIPNKNQKEIIEFKVFGRDVYSYRAVRSGIFNSGELEEKLEEQYPRYNVISTETRHAKYDFEDKREDLRETKMSGQNLMILAPQHKFNTIGREIVNGVLGVVNEDPIVLQPVNLGFLIVSSWGLEANDELVVNSINN